MTDEGGILVPVVVEKRDEIARQMCDVVGRHFGRTGRVAVTPLVRCDDVVSRRDQGGHLVAPGEGELGPPVTKHNGPSRVLPARFEDLQFHAVDGDEGGLGEVGWTVHRGF
jgi:hypothetical protein